MNLKQLVIQQGLTVTDECCPIKLLNTLQNDKVDELDSKYEIGLKLIPYCKADDCNNCWDININYKEE